MQKEVESGRLHSPTRIAGKVRLIAIGSVSLLLACGLVLWIHRGKKSAFQRGNKYREAGNHRAAIEAYTEALRLRPRDIDALGNRAASYLDIGEYQKGIADLTASLNIVPTDPWAIGGRARAYEVSKQYDKALLDYTTAIDMISPSVSMIHVYRGIVHRKMGQLDDAAKDFLTVVTQSREPRLTTSAYRNLGIVRFCQGQWREAHDAFAGRLKVSPPDGEAAVFLYMTAHLSGIEGKQDFMEFVSKYPNMDKWNASILGLFSRRIPPEEVLATLSRGENNVAYDQQRKCDTQFYLGMFYLMENNRDMAKFHLRQCLTQKYEESVGYICTPYLLGMGLLTQTEASGGAVGRDSCQVTTNFLLEKQDSGR